VISETEFVHLNPGQVIHDARETITCGYFINTGVVSILAAQRDGKGLKVGVIGNEGFTALPLLVEYHTSCAACLAVVYCELNRRACK
jgi:CRP-like cAMP-binding protein